MDGLHEAGRLLIKNGKQGIWNHSQAVAVEAVLLGERFGVDPYACELAALCHDIGGVVPVEEMLEQAQKRGMVIDPAEARYPFLLHQRFSEILCRDYLKITDEAVLSAVGCHTTLKANASDLDMIIFLADKIAWDQEGEPPYEPLVLQALDQSLRQASLAYIDYTMAHGMILMPHQWLLQAREWLAGEAKQKA